MCCGVSAVVGVLTVLSMAVSPLPDPEPRYVRVLAPDLVMAVLVTLKSVSEPSRLIAPAPATVAPTAKAVAIHSDVLIYPSSDCVSRVGLLGGRLVEDDMRGRPRASVKSV
jgi:hypothetical protein